MDQDSMDNEKTIGRAGSKGNYALAAGQTLGQYRIIRPLGRGGMGEVYEVEHQVLRRRYALKLLPEDFAGQSGALARFEREAQVMANLEHPNIIRVDDFGETGGRYWLRMELAGGQEPGTRRQGAVSLQDLADTRGGRIPQEELVGILKQILEGLAYAHGHGAIHRDLKPSNILFSGGTAKIADFGLVRLVGEEWVRSQAQVSVQRSMSMGDLKTMQKDTDEGTSTRSMLGTYEYMSPEQKRGEEATARSDLYAVGLMAYKLVTGQNLGVKLPSRIHRGLIGEWDDFVEKALEERAGDRWPDAQTMADELAGIAQAIRRVDDEKQATAKMAENARWEREEAERKARTEAEARRKEQEHRAAEAVRAAEQMRSETTAKADTEGAGWMWLVAAVLVGGGAILLWPRESSSPAKPVVAAPRQSASASPAVLPTPRAEPASTSAADNGPVPGQDARIEDLGLDLVWVGPGSFRMGSESGSSDEQPVREVQIAQGFWMGKTEVTQGQWKQVMGGSNPSNGKGGDDLPVESVSWHDATNFCAKLTARERANLPQGYVYRLPTEAEWEYAARGGPNQASHRYKYAGSDTIGDVAWYGGISGNTTYAVGMKGSNVLGLHDMSGNVCEWCWDWYWPYGPQDRVEPSGVPSVRVVRGGSFSGDFAGCRVADRNSGGPSFAFVNLGFRVVLAVPVQ